MSVQQGIERFRERAKGIRGQALGGRLAGQKIGNGALISQAKGTMNRMSRRLIERKPGVMSMVKEFKPGSRVKGIFGHAVLNPRIGSMSVEGSPAKIPRGGKRGFGEGRQLAVVQH